MGSKSSISPLLFLLINTFFCSIVIACSDHVPPPPPPPPKPICSPPPPPHSPPPPKHQSSPPPPHSPSPKPQSSPPPPPRSHSTPTPPSSNKKCPRDTLKLEVCADLLGGLASLSIGAPRDCPCCDLIKGLVDLEAAVCLCTAIKAHVLHVINLEVDVSLTLILNTCGKRVPSGFQCAY